MQNNKRNFTLLLSASMLVVAALYALDKKQFTQLVTPQPEQQQSITIKRQSTDRSKILFDEQGIINPSLLALFELTGIQHNGTLASIVEQTQQKWLRASGKERWQINELYPEKREQALALLDDLGCLAALAPTHKQYDYAVILGATAPAIRVRLGYLVQLWQQGIRFEQLIFLGGARPLDPQRESQAVLFDINNTILPAKPTWHAPKQLPTTELQMMQFLYEQADLPEELAEQPVHFINTPLQKIGANGLRNPNTADIITSWLTTDPEIGSCLFVSNNPYIGYQDAAIRTTMPDNFTIETVGSAASDETKLSVHLDNCARWLYQEKVRREKNI